VRLGNRVTSEELNQYFRSLYTHPQQFVKWVTVEHISPNFDEGTLLHYPIRAVIECPEALISDQQCGVGLHVLRLGYRPEWVGLCAADHKYIPILVEVAPEDICFAGLPTMDVKLRVRKLKVLN